MKTLQASISGPVSVGSRAHGRQQAPNQAKVAATSDANVAADSNSIGQERLEGFTGQRMVVVPRPMLTTAMQYPLLRTVLPTDAGFYPKAEGHQCSRPRGCTETVFIYCSDGRGWCDLGGRRHQVARNQLLVIQSGAPHTYGACEDRPWTIHWFHAIGSNVPVYIERLGTSIEAPVVSLGGSPQLPALFEELIGSLQHGFTLTRLIYASHCLVHLLGLILRHKEEYWPWEPNVRERIGRTIEFMKGHLREPLDVAALASLASLSRSHYTTLFRRVTGYAPLNYLNHLRMQKAVELLNSTGWPVKKISDHLGFSDQFYFSRTFSRMHNHSPTEHRKRYGG